MLDKNLKIEDILDKIAEEVPGTMMNVHFDKEEDLIFLVECLNKGTKLELFFNGVDAPEYDCEEAYIEDNYYSLKFKGYDKEKMVEEVKNKFIA